MYILKRGIGLSLFLFLTFLFGACASMSTSGNISAKANRGFSFHSSQHIYVALPEPQSATEKGFRELLVSEMRHAGLAVTDQLSQDSLVLFFRMDNESKNIVRIPGNPAISRLPSQWQEIYLELYSVKDVKDPGPVWEGYIKIPIRKFNAQPGDTVRPLLELVGKSYEGPMPIRVYTKADPGPSTEEMDRLEEKVKTLEEQIEKLQTPSDSSDSSEKGSPPSPNPP